MMNTKKEVKIINFHSLLVDIDHDKVEATSGMNGLKEDLQKIHKDKNFHLTQEDKKSLRETLDEVDELSKSIRETYLD